MCFLKHKQMIAQTRPIGGLQCIGLGCRPAYTRPGLHALGLASIHQAWAACTRPSQHTPGLCFMHKSQPAYTRPGLHALGIVIICTSGLGCMYQAQPTHTKAQAACTRPSQRTLEPRLHALGLASIHQAWAACTIGLASIHQSLGCMHQAQPAYTRPGLHTLGLATRACCKHFFFLDPDYVLKKIFTQQTIGYNLYCSHIREFHSLYTFTLQISGLADNR